MIEPKRLAVFVDFDVKPQFAQAFRKEILLNAELSRRDEPGCHVFDVCVSTDGLKFSLYEIYSDSAAFDVHRGTEHFTHFDKASRDWIESKTVRTFDVLNAIA